MKIKLWGDSWEGVTNLTAPTGSVSVGGSSRELTTGCTNSPPLARRCQKRGKAPRMLTGLFSNLTAPTGSVSVGGSSREPTTGCTNSPPLAPTLSETRKGAAHADRSVFHPKKTTSTNISVAPGSGSSGRPLNSSTGRVQRAHSGHRASCQKRGKAPRHADTLVQGLTAPTGSVSVGCLKAWITPNKNHLLYPDLQFKFFMCANKILFSSKSLQYSFLISE